MDLFGNASYRDSMYKLACKSSIHVAMLVVVAVELGMNRKVTVSPEFESQNPYDPRSVAFGFIVTSGTCIVVQILCFIWRANLYNQRKTHLMEVCVYMCTCTYIHVYMCIFVATSGTCILEQICVLHLARTPV
jgi:hypothetical protein